MGWHFYAHNWKWGTAALLSLLLQSAARRLTNLSQSHPTLWAQPQHQCHGPLKRVTERGQGSRALRTATGWMRAMAGEGTCGFNSGCLAVPPTPATSSQEQSSTPWVGPNTTCLVTSQKLTPGFSLHFPGWWSGWTFGCHLNSLLFKLPVHTSVHFLLDCL